NLFYMLIGKLLAIIIIFAIAFAFSGCGTIYRGVEQEVTILSDPIGVRATIDHKVTVITPDAVSLSRRKDHSITFEQEGYETIQIQIRKKVDTSIIANIALSYYRIITGTIDYLSGGGCNLYPGSINVKLQKKEGNPAESEDFGNFVPVNVVQQYALKARKRIILTVTDRLGKSLISNLYGLQDDTLLLCSLSWGEKPIGIKLQEISKIEIDNRANTQRWAIDTALITDLAFTASVLPVLKYNLEYFLVMFFGPTFGFYNGAPIGALMSLVKGINTHIDFSSLPEPDKAKIIMKLLNN
ncbi:PEGA domain-containing protein, partial [Candidatus Poribacteria bacterium]|nr:PEGA domain-containing protein [Candidatus Poribacteria bacterium]